jgi:hypothetical protein
MILRFMQIGEEYLASNFSFNLLTNSVLLILPIKYKYKSIDSVPCKNQSIILLRTLFLERSTNEVFITDLFIIQIDVIVLLFYCKRN